MLLMSVCWSTFISVTTWDETGLDTILESENRLYKFLNQCILLGVDDVTWAVNIYSYSVDILDNKA